MRKLYGSTNWRRLLALVLVFAMLFSAMGTSGYSVFADSQDETGEAVYAAEPEVVTPDVTEDIQGPSPGEDAEEAAEAPELTEDAEAEAADEESEETVDAEAEEGEEPEESEAVEEGEESAEPAEEAGEDEEIAEPVEEAGEDEEIAEPVEEIAEAEEPAEVALVEEDSQKNLEDAEEPAAVSIVEEFKNGLAEELAAPSEEVVEPVEAAEEAEPAEEPEIVYPAWIDVKGFINGTTVTINAEAGTFPEGTEMVLSEVNTADIWDTVADALDAPVVKMRAVDITFIYGGEEIQPLKPISVKMNASGYDAYAERSVVHIDDKGEASVVEDADTSKKAIEFEAEHFSVYVVVQTEYPRLTIKFMNDGASPVLMYVKGGEHRDTDDEIDTIVYDPGVIGLQDNEVFRGWVANNENYASDSTFLTINDIRSAVKAKIAAPLTADEEITYYAGIFKQFTVTYTATKPNYDNTGTTTVVVGAKTEEIPRSETEATHVVNMSYTVDDSHNFMGWIVVTGGDNIKGYPDNTEKFVENGETIQFYPNNKELTITGPVTFKPYTPEGQWLVFDENGRGGKYNAPQFVLVNEKTKRPIPDTEMVRYGYDFVGWYLWDDVEAYYKETGEIEKDLEELRDSKTKHIPIPEGLTVYSFDQVIEKKTVLLADWTPQTTGRYTVICWTQNESSINKSEKEYDLKEAFVENSALMDSAIPYQFVDNGAEDYVRMTINGESIEAHYTGFCLTEGSKNQIVKVTPEGDAVLNLYFDRIEYNLRFYLYRQQGSGNSSYSYAENSRRGGNVWDIATWYNNTSLGNMPTADYPILHEDSTFDGYTGYYFVLQATYGEDISSKWPTYTKIHGPANNRQPVSFIMMDGAGMKPAGGTGSGRDTVKGLITVLDERILGATNNKDGNFLIVRFNSFNNWTYNIYYETIEGVEYDPTKIREINGTQYYWDHDVQSRSSNTDAAQQNPPQYPGFITVKDGSGDDYYDGVASNNGYQLNYYYDRLAFPVSYFDGAYVDGKGNELNNNGLSLLETSEDIGQGEPIPNDVKNHTPKLPAGEEGYVFEGWYSNAKCTIPYTFTSMPIGGIKVYAKWRQIEYRVFLRPNFPGGVTDELKTLVGDTNIWGSASQELNFKITYGGKVSVPTGKITGYEFYGWYLDEAGSKVYPESMSLKENDFLVDYNKDDPSNYTDTMDQFGLGATFNKDKEENRTWVTKKLDLYGSWGKLVVGADGITVTYDVTDDGVADSVPADTANYLDNTFATAQIAATPKEPEKKVFDHWELQTWTEDGFDSKPKTNPILPGENFKVFVDDARITNAAGEVIAHDSIEKDVHYTYMVQLKAVYKDVEVEDPTYIIWYDNYSDDNEGKGIIYRTDDPIKINEGVDIYGLGSDESIPERTGFTFKGWTKTKGGKTADFLIWDAANKQYTTVEGTKAIQVAADDRPDLEDLFAVWEEADVTISYAVASDSTGKGSVDRPSETIKAISGSAAGSEAIPGSNYLFDYWTCDDGTEHVGPEAAFVPEKNSDGIYEAHTYYAHFKEKPAMGGVTVHHYLLGTTAKVADDVTVEVLVGEDYTASPKTTYDGKSLTVASYDPKQTITVQAGNNNVIAVYYTLPLTVTATTASKPYDSTPLNGGYTATGALAADEETIANAIEACIEETPSVTNVTEEPLEYFTEEETSDLVIEGIPEYYVVTYESGSLAITPAKITVTADDKTKVYKAEDPELTATIDGTLYGEDTISYTLSREKGEEIGPYIITPAGEASQGNYEVTFKTGTLRITGEGYVSIKKEVTSTPKNGDKYTLGEEITYKITVKNEGQTVTINNIKVEDELVDKVWTIESLAPGAAYEITDIRYTVTEEDILAGSVVNVGVISEGTPVPPDTPDSPPETPPFTPDPPVIVPVETEAPRAGLSITKEAVSSPALSEGYALNETVKYQITVQNTGNVTLTNVTVTDTKLKKQTWTVGTYDEELETYTFAPGATYTLPEMDTTYIVAEADVTAGEIVNVATVTGKGPAVEGLDGVVTVYDPDPATDTETVPTTAKTPVKTLKVAFYTNYPDEVLEKGWINEYSATKEVPTPYEVPGFVTVFDSSMIPDGFKTESWEVHKPAKASGGANDVVNADEGTVNENGMASTSSSSNGTKITEEPSDVDIIFYALWEEDNRFVPSGGTIPPKDPDPNPDDPDPDDEPDPDIPDPDVPLSPYEEEDEIPDEDTPFSDYEEEPDEELDEEPTPLSPYTGDDRHTAAWGFVSLLSLAGIAVLGRKRREEE